MKKKMKVKPTFKKYDDFASWHDDNAGEYEETEIDGYLVGLLYKNGRVIGMWYNRASIGTISDDFTTVYPNLRDDEDIIYAESDSFWPYD